MRRESQTPLLSSRAKRGIWLLRSDAAKNCLNSFWLAFGWRSAFSAAINALRLATALAAELIKQQTSEFQQEKPRQQVFSLLRKTEAAAIVEFAVALPLLIVLVVGIFDFGSAFNLKQELNNAVREGARFGAAQPTNDVTPTNQTPASVDAIRFLVDSYLQTAKINDCGLSAIPEPNQGGGMVWTYYASSGCAGTLTLIISRAVPVQVTANGSTVNMLCTTVQILYPFQWHFNNVIKLLVPGATYASVTEIPSDATAANAD
jgi:Flp pilus assembly protein TadG